MRDIILWADHRAVEEARLINSTGSMVLKYVGGTMSLEMEIPKTLWLKRHMPTETFKDLMIFDLPDMLTYKATGSFARSNCSLACKCSYVPPGVEGSKGWNDDFFKKIGLEEFVRALWGVRHPLSFADTRVLQIQDDFKQLGGSPGKNGTVLTAGQPVGNGLSAQAAEELGLCEGTAVGSAVIDAYAGWLGSASTMIIDFSTCADIMVRLQPSAYRCPASSRSSTRRSTPVVTAWPPSLARALATSSSRRILSLCLACGDPTCMRVSLAVRLFSHSTSADSLTRRRLDERGRSVIDRTASRLHHRYPPSICSSQGNGGRERYQPLRPPLRPPRGNGEGAQGAIHDIPDQGLLSLPRPSWCVSHHVSGSVA